MGNYTMFDTVSLRHFFCSKGGMLSEENANVAMVWPTNYIKFVPFLKSRSMHPFFPSDVQTELRFLSCGKRGRSSLAWRELG